MKPEQDYPINDHRSPAPTSFFGAPLSHTSSLNTSVEKRRDRSTRKKQAVMKLSAVEEISPVKVEAFSGTGLVLEESSAFKPINNKETLSPKALFLQNKNKES